VWRKGFIAVEIVAGKTVSDATKKAITQLRLRARQAMLDSLSASMQVKSWPAMTDAARAALEEAKKVAKAKLPIALDPKSQALVDAFLKSGDGLVANMKKCGDALKRDLGDWEKKLTDTCKTLDDALSRLVLKGEKAGEADEKLDDCAKTVDAYDAGPGKKIARLREEFARMLSDLSKLTIKIKTEGAMGQMKKLQGTLRRAR
jgi:hypothetical protein